MYAYGLIESPTDYRDYPLGAIMGTQTRHARDHLPTWTPPVLNQGHVQSCVGHALASLRMIQEYNERSTRQLLSPSFVYHNRKDRNYQGEGMVTRDALDNMITDGIPFNSDYNNNIEYKYAEPLTAFLFDRAKPRKITKYVRLYNVNEIMTAIKELGAVLVGVPILDSFIQPVNGVIERDNGQSKGGHAVILDGWTGYDGIGKFYFTGQNSWSDRWGDKGRFKLASDYQLLEAWAVTDAPTVGDKRYRLIPGEPFMTDMDTMKQIPLDVPAQIVNGRTLAPLRAIAELTGKTVDWIPEDGAIYICK